MRLDEAAEMIAQLVAEGYLVAPESRHDLEEGEINDEYRVYPYMDHRRELLLMIENELAIRGDGNATSPEAVIPQPANGKPHLSLKEFVEEGWLQEVNRWFFHIRGLALTINVPRDETGRPVLSDSETWFVRVQDGRDDPEGFIFGEGILDQPEAIAKAQTVEEVAQKHSSARAKLFDGSVLQPIIYPDIQVPGLKEE